MAWVGMLAEFSNDASADERRGEVRRKLHLESVLSGPRPPSKVVVLDLTQAGMLLYATADLEIGDAFTVELPIAGGVDARVKWKRTELYGCEFVKPISRGVVSAMLLKATHDRIAES